MAKKKSRSRTGADIAVVEDQPQAQQEEPKAGRGQKQCPKCRAILGARSVVCKNSGHRFKTEAKAGKKRGRRSATGVESISIAGQLQAANKFVQLAGSFDQAIELLKAVKAIKEG